MTVRECYSLFDGDYIGTLSRFGEDDRIRRFTTKFLSDTTFTNLQDALSEERWEDAFRAAHTLKGICLNLGFTVLYGFSSDLTELLRDLQPKDVSASLKTVETEYQKTIAAISQL